MTQFTHGIWGNWIEERLKKEEMSIWLDDNAEGKGRKTKRMTFDTEEEQRRAKKQRKKEKKEKKDAKRLKAASMSGSDDDDDGFSSKRARKSRASGTSFWEQVEGWDEFGSTPQPSRKDTIKPRRGMQIVDAPPSPPPPSLTPPKKRRAADSDSDEAAEC
eukprot:Hpha_TRINITY_DN15997_c11_g1::TRINITY_DN15997_c11_g1_i1::g.70364::m.70364